MATVLVVTAVPAERDAVVGALGGAGEVDQSRHYPRHRADQVIGTVDVAACGVGPAEAAAGTATLLATTAYDLVVCAGIGGGFRGRAAVRDVAVADRIVYADLGADSPAGFLSMGQLGFGENEYELRADLVTAAADRLRTAGTGGGRVWAGPILTVSTATGTDERAEVLAARHGAVAEGMEGAGAYAAASAHGIPLLELRAISNLVGRRDRSAWDIPVALTTLGNAVATLLGAELAL